MNRTKKLGVLLWILTIMTPVGLNAQQAITHGGKKPQSNQQRPKKRPNRTKEAILRDLCNNMVTIEGGTFKMGATSEQGTPEDNNEKPIHNVTVTSFSIGRYEVTQEEWQAVMGSNPSENISPKRPVENVSWNDCQRFITKLNQLTGRTFRLPTEAEWEYAARGGRNKYKFSGSNNINEVGWCKTNSGGDTHVVGQKEPNELGLYDMSGNVGEWCQDWWGGYSATAQTNPHGPFSGKARITRGGSVNGTSEDCKVSIRFGDTPDAAYWNIGFRLAE